MVPNFGMFYSHLEMQVGMTTCLRSLSRLPCPGPHECVALPHPTGHLYSLNVVGWGAGTVFKKLLYLQFFSDMNT